MTSRAAAKDLAKKIRLENRFKPKLRTIFRQMARDVASVWRATGSMANLDTYNLDMTALLREHYRAVSRSFSNDLRSNKHVRESIETKQEQELDAEIAEYIAGHSIQQSGFILDTTQDRLSQIVAGVLVDNSQLEDPIPAQELSDEIEREFRQDSFNRVDTIAMTETQTPSEAIKFLEASVVAAALTPGQAMVKTWNTVLDEKTRASHVEADRQVQPLNQPFIVQGERLMEPGDTSLGASLSNIVNCRCSAVYTPEGIDVAPLDIPRQLL